MDSAPPDKATVDQELLYAEICIAFRCSRAELDEIMAAFAGSRDRANESPAALGERLALEQIANRPEIEQAREELGRSLDRLLAARAESDRVRPTSLPEPGTTTPG